MEQESVNKSTRWNGIGNSIEDKNQSYDISRGKMEGAIRIASLTGRKTNITIKLP